MNLQQPKTKDASGKLAEKTKKFKDTTDDGEIVIPKVGVKPLRFHNEYG